MAENLLISTGASAEVQTNLNIYQGTAFAAITKAREALVDMVKSIPGLPESTVNPGQSVGNISYQKNGAPPVWNFAFEPPEYAIDRPALKNIVTTKVDDFTGSPPAQVSPNIPIRPTSILPEAPGDAPLVTDITIPDAPVKNAIANPKEYAISIPVAPIITIPIFTGQKPLNNIVKPDGSFNWQEDPYSSETLDKIIYNVNDYLDGGVGMPNEVWEHIWAKDNDREQRAGITLRSEIDKEFSERGFQLTQGTQLARLDKVNQIIFNGSQERSREIGIKEASLEIENLRFAVSQGVALEQLRGSWHQAGLSRLFDATRYSSELAVTVFNAEVAFYNAQVQAYVSELEAWKVELQGELAKLEIYKSELDAQKLIGELNQQEVDKYNARLQALTIDLDYYNSTLQGLKLTTETDALRIDSYSKTVQAYGEKVRAISTEYDAYQTAMQGAKIEADIGAVNTQIFSTTVDAYAKKSDVEINKSRLGIDINNQAISEYEALQRGYLAQMEGAIKNLVAKETEHKANLSTFMSNLDSEKLSVTTQTAERSADAQNAAQITQANIQNAKTNAANALAEMQAVLGVYDAIAKVEAAYSNSAMSAVSLSMGMSDGASNSATYKQP